jgi:hypothetical protein
MQKPLALSFIRTSLRIGYESPDVGARLGRNDGRGRIVLDQTRPTASVGTIFRGRKQTTGVRPFMWLPYRHPAARGHCGKPAHEGISARVGGVHAFDADGLLRRLVRHAERGEGGQKARTEVTFSQVEWEE